MITFHANKRNNFAFLIEENASFRLMGKFTIKKTEFYLAAVF